MANSSRVIKFRAWNIKINSMGSPLPLKVWIDDVATEIGREKYLRDRDNIILMQYTGLKDKNGNEIYEGDVIKNGEELYEVCWNRISFYFIHLNSKGTYVSDAIDINESRFEVVGNIYSNPDLRFETIGNIHENPNMLPNP